MTSAHRANPIPNILTGARLAAGVVMFLILAGATSGFPLADQWMSPDDQFALYRVAFWIFVIAASTDWIDGFWARRFGQVTRVGEILDPVADRIAFLDAAVDAQARRQAERCQGAGRGGELHPRIFGIEPRFHGMAMAFQRIRERIRRSMKRSPGIGACWDTGILFRNGVVMEYGSSVPSRLARSESLSRMYLARSTPSFSIRDSSASSHSLVSMGSSSWYIKPSPWHQKVQRRHDQQPGALRCR